jgi:hypothetical protein
MTPNSVFNDLLRDIEPSQTTKANAASAHAALRDHLSSHEEFKKVHKKTFLSGSYKRDTAIRPRASGGQVERPEVDVIIVTTHSFNDNPADVLHLLYKAVKDGYATVRKQQRSVGLETAKAASSNLVYARNHSVLRCRPGLMGGSVLHTLGSSRDG